MAFKPSIVKRNRLLLEFKQAERTDREAKRTFWDKVFRRPAMYIGFSIHRCTTMPHAMDFIRNKGIKKVISAYFYDKEGHRHRMIEKGKISMRVRVNTYGRI
jgi:hypothetical protein